MLLAALLDASQLPYRFAIGTITAETESRLIAALTPDPDKANAAYSAAIAASEEFLEQSGVSTSEELSPTDQALLDDFVSQATTVVDQTDASTDRNRTVIDTALGSSGITLPQLPSAALVARESDAHCWLQVPDGPNWTDLDPTADPSSPPPEPTSTFANLPDDWYHRVTVSVAAEELAYGSLSRSEIVTFSSSSRDLIDVPIAINIAPAEAIAGLGNTLNQIMSGQLSVIPSIFVDGTSVDGARAMIFGTGGESTSDILSTEGTPVAGALDGETLAVWLTVEIASPDAEPVIIDRAILDRIPPLDRASGIIDPASIYPVRTEPSAFEQDELDTIVQFNRFIALSVDVARIPGGYALAHSLADPTMGSIHLFGPSLATNRDNLGIRHEADAGYWSYPSGPNVTAFAFAVEKKDPGRSSISVDILHRQRTSHRFGNTPADTSIHPLVLSGVLDAVAEHMLLLSGTYPGDTSGSSPVSAGVVFEQAAAHEIEVATVITSADLDALDLPDSARVQIQESLAAGSIVIIPRQPVEVANQPLMAWWVVDPDTGRTLDRMGNGTGGASARFTTPANIAYASDMPFYARWIEWITANAKLIGCIGNGVGLIAAVAATLLAGSVGNGAGYAIGTVATIGQFLRLVGACAAL
jgi:hypothetical protein